MTTEQMQYVLNLRDEIMYLQRKVQDMQALFERTLKESGISKPVLLLVDESSLRPASAPLVVPQA